MPQHRLSCPPSYASSLNPTQDFEGILKRAGLREACNDLVQDSSPSTAAAHARAILHVPVVLQSAVDGNAMLEKLLCR